MIVARMASVLLPKEYNGGVPHLNVAMPTQSGVDGMTECLAEVMAFNLLDCCRCCVSEGENNDFKLVAVRLGIKYCEGMEVAETLTLGGSKKCVPKGDPKGGVHGGGSGLLEAAWLSQGWWRQVRR